LVENQWDWQMGWRWLSVIACTMLPNPHLVLFGPQLTQLQWTIDCLGQLQSDFQNNPRLAFLGRCLAQLPAFIASLPLAQNDVVARLETLARFAGGSEAPDSTALSNVQLAPLTVVPYMVEWLSITSSDIVAQGFCVGFLSAAVVATATQHDFEHYAATAIRIAACVGLVIDAEDASHDSADRATAVSVRVRLALTGASRQSNVFLGSVKDNIGHAGAASGAAGLIKTILMMHHF
jgi:hypothetical protein